MRPRDASTLIILRKEREVLLGVRTAHHVFMPHCYVFPGGRVDPGDSRVKSPYELQTHVEAQLLESVTPARARGLAMAAVRETFEETGLLLGAPPPQHIRTRSPHWQPFYQSGLVPALDKLSYFARAITPPRMVRRFDARFFTVDARYMSGELKSNGELEDLHWVDLAEVGPLNLAPITRLVLQLLRQRMEDDNSTPESLQLYRDLNRKELFDHRG
ncbi:MAG: 8-oxo-dGTP pyrophosphatase MutT (NUDIX family) [Halieaceae bacterium]|jgi:8-oxo-dGTP pyrophosphatase MutT (NUDIX family)